MLPRFFALFPLLSEHYLDPGGSGGNTSCLSVGGTFALFLPAFSGRLRAHTPRAHATPSSLHSPSYTRAPHAHTQFEYVPRLVPESERLRQVACGLNTCYALDEKGQVFAVRAGSQDGLRMVPMKRPYSKLGCVCTCTRTRYRVKHELCTACFMWFACGVRVRGDI